MLFICHENNSSGCKSVEMMIQPEGLFIEHLNVNAENIDLIK